MDEPARTGRPVERHYQKRLALLYYGGMAKEKVIRGKQDDAAHDGLRSNRRREGEAQAEEMLYQQLQLSIMVYSQRMSLPADLVAYHEAVLREWGLLPGESGKA